MSTTSAPKLNLFAFIGQLLARTISSITKAFDVLDTSMDAINNVATMAKATTQSMLDEQAVEAQQALEELKAMSKS